jgi:serine/threonine protein kinase/tetratricopeptide (TPR) repeat protein
MNEREIFIGALQEDCPAERQAYLDRACGTDTVLRRRVEGLLRDCERSAGFLNAPAIDLGATLDELALEQPGTVIGPYKLLEQIGEGGMGLVFVAEQTRPVRRRVALKVVKPGMDTRQVVARFETERQALALMDHPNIARVFDAGTTASGRPYFVMELVRGVPITAFCDERRLTTRQRLELFVSVCQAVQHAHQKGIIHRDLKPSNVLVTLHDTVAVPKVIDFGIAKATTGPLTEQTVYTNFAQLLGTPLYMSPEQAEMNGLDVDTRSDVYSLGVLLYELLTGTTPFASDTLKKVGLDEMRRLIREEEPPTPSRRLSTLSAQACSTVSERLGVDGRRLARMLCGELDWIVMKALEKDRNRRYESASAFAQDVQRYLNDEPVAACPPSAGYRLRKYMRRNRPALVTAGVVAVALVAATVVSAWQALIARDAQHQAEADRDRAKTAEVTAQAAKRQATTEAAVARAVKDFLQEDLFGQANSAPEDDNQGWNGNANLTVREALDRASAKVGKRFRDQPLVEAAIWHAIGQAYGSLDQHLDAANHLEQALELRRPHLGRNHPETLHTMSLLAGAYTWVGRAPEAVVLYEHLLESTRARHGPDHPATLDVIVRLATACRRAGDWHRAMRLMEQVVEQEQAQRGLTVASASGSAHVLGMLYLDAGRFQEACARLDKVFALRKATLGPDHNDTLYVMGSCAQAYQRAGKLDEADRCLRNLLERRRKRGDSKGQIEIARALEFLSLNSLLQHRYTEAEQQAREAMTLLEKNENNRIHDYDWRRCYLMNLLGGALAGHKRYAEAKPLLLQGYEGMKQREALIAAQFRFRSAEAGERVVRYYEEINQPGKAREWRERLREDKSKK